MQKNQSGTTGRAALAALALSLALGAALTPARAAEDTKKQLLDLTGGRRAKVVWNQDNKVKLFDTKTGKIEDLPMASGSAPLFSKDGNNVFVSTGKAPAERAVLMYDTKTKKVTELAKGPGNNLLAVWTDPKTKKIWVYVNDSGDKGENWDVPAGKIYRFPTDKPAAREMYWERTSSHGYLMFSEDGTRACFEPNWANIGQLKLAYTADGKVDQEKSEYKQFGGGCFPSMAPDNSYRLFRLSGDHSAIELCDADNTNLRKVQMLDMLKARNIPGNCWLTRWSTHPRYITCVAPGNNEARIWMGRFDAEYTKIEAWVQVSEEKSPQCWQSQAWVEGK